jgi:hypothetical protein
MPLIGNKCYLLDNEEFISIHKFSSENDVTIEIYNSNRTLISSSQGTIDLPNNSSNVTYFIVISGSRTMDFKFEKK